MAQSSVRHTGEAPLEELEGMRAGRKEGEKKRKGIKEGGRKNYNIYKF